MSRRSEQVTMIQSLIRLRRAQQQLPPNRDLVAVSSAIEQSIGPTLSQRLAAEVLEVSHTALARWVRSGDIPLVVTPDGSAQVSLRSLVGLAIEIDRGRKEDGPRRRHALESVMLAQRDAANRIRSHWHVSIPAERRDPHRRALDFSIAYHREIARKLTRALADDALRNVWHLRESGQMDGHYADRWESLLVGTLSSLRVAMVEESADADDLRQNSPFAGMLSEPERQAVLELATA